MTYWTPKKLARYAAQRGKPITPKHIRTLCRQGVIKAAMPGTEWVIENDEAERWIAEWTKNK